MKRASYLMIFLLTIGIGKGFSQTYSSIVNDSIIEELIIYNINLVDSDFSKKKKKVNLKPILWKEADQDMISFEITVILDFVKEQKLLNNQDTTYYRKQFNSQVENNWKFKLIKGNKIKKHKTHKSYSYSIPIFDVEQKKAIIYEEYFCKRRQRCGLGYFKIFEKTKIGWTLTKKIDYWVQ